MLNIVVIYLLAMKLESIRSKIMKKLFESQGDISLDKLMVEVNDTPSMNERLLVQIVVINCIDMIKDGVEPFNEREVRRLLRNCLDNIGSGSPEVHQSDVDSKLMELVEYFHNGRKAFKMNPLSMEGIRYSLEIEDKRPFRKQELAGLKRLSERMKSVNCLF
jgi:hypothetical protein